MRQQVAEHQHTAAGDHDVNRFVAGMTMLRIGLKGGERLPRSAAAASLSAFIRCERLKRIGQDGPERAEPEHPLGEFIAFRAAFDPAATESTPQLAGTVAFAPSTAPSHYI